MNSSLKLDYFAAPINFFIPEEGRQKNSDTKKEN